MSMSLEHLLERLLVETRELEQAVLSNEDDGEAWGQCLERRESTMNQISKLLEQGVILSNDHKRNYVEPAYKIHQQLLPVMKEKMMNISAKLMNARRNREIMPHYGDIDFNGYGVFFDKKK